MHCPTEPERKRNRSEGTQGLLHLECSRLGPHSEDTPKSAELARGFNSFSRTSCPIRFTEITVHKIISGSQSRPKLGESVIVEEYIAGEFKKWCSNYGYISEESYAQCMPAFMHWSWVHTRGERMVADLQGVLKPDGFVLTDPVMMSLSNSYGPTDTGAEGMIMFFYKHQCNSYCQSLPRPKPADFISSVPQHELRECLGRLAQLQASTTYTVDLNLSSRTRQIVAGVLRSVATRCY